MRVTLINTKDNGGGAAVACNRLVTALRGNNVEATMLVQHKTSDKAYIAGIVVNAWIKIKSEFHFLYERLSFIIKERERSVRFAFSPANAGEDISKHKLIVQADILHLHWINSGFLSVENLKALLKINKPVIWTLHDMWAFTGGCHYSGSCDHYLNECGNCYFLKHPHPADVSHSGWLQKKDLYALKEKIVFVTCSSWLANIAGQSALLKGFRIEAIPNPIDTETYSAKSKELVRKKWNIDPGAHIILFGAANVQDKRKGMAYLIKALHLLKSADAGSNIQVILFGKNKSFDPIQIPFPVMQLPVITSASSLVEIYNTADVFVLPSLEDNLPNMVMESMSCGVPVVAFKQGGIPEMIDHLDNGYIAEYKNVDDLANGINWVLKTDTYKSMSVSARNKVLASYGNSRIAEKYIRLYESVLHKNGTNL